MSQSASTAFWSSWTGSRPSLRALPRKMSPNRAAMTTLKPQSRSAQTACWRDEPVPKLGPATCVGGRAGAEVGPGHQDRGPRVRRIVEHEARILAPGAEQPVLEAGAG